MEEAGTFVVSVLVRPQHSLDVSLAGKAIGDEEIDELSTVFSLDSSRASDADWPGLLVVLQVRLGV